MNCCKQRTALTDRINYLNINPSLQQNKSKNTAKRLIIFTQHYQEIVMKYQKQNHSIQQKKIKLKLKTVASKDISKKQQPKTTLNVKQLKITQQTKLNNFRIKNSKNQKQNISNSEIKENKLKSKLKPNVIYFSLKSLPECTLTTIQSKQIANSQLNKNEIKQKPKPKNYKLLSFISQVLHKITLFIPNISQQSQQTFTIKQLFTYEMNYSEVIQFIYSLGMIRKSSQEDYKVQNQEQMEELQKVYLIWRILKSNSAKLKQAGSNKINAVNLIILLTSIVNIYEDTYTIIETLKQKEQQILKKKCKIFDKESHAAQPKHIFFIRNKKLLQTLDNIKISQFQFINPNHEFKTLISKEFQLFRINRLNSEVNIKTNQEQLQIHDLQQQFTIHSLISPKSQQLAMTKRLKILQEINCSEQVPITKDSVQKSDLNLFLNYKKPNKCRNNAKNVSNKQNQKNTSTLQKQKKILVNPHKNVYIPSQKIKFSQLNSILKMQKARQIKLQKKLILEKGWTNNGQFSGKTSRVNQIGSSNKNKKQNQLNLRTQQSCKSLQKRPQNKKNFFQSRKNSFKTLSNKNQQNIDSKHSYKMQAMQKDKYERNEDKYLESQENQNNTMIHHQSEQQESLNQTISIDENQQLDFDNHFYYEGKQQMQNDDFLQTERQKDNEQNDEDQRNMSLDQNKRDSQSNCKTFTTEVNQENIEQTSQVETKINFGLQNQQHRVIKSYLRIPILYVDVNMDQSKKQRIIIFEQDNPTQLAQQFGNKHNLDQIMIQRLQQMLKQQISGILGRIDEEDDQYEQTKQDIFNGLAQQDIQQIQNQQ